MPYSGPASSCGVIGKTEAAYFNKINAEGGINGRKITFISYDDAYSAQSDRAGAQAGGGDEEQCLRLCAGAEHG
jgi:ABC-type branched-subunit amino acid transport system substrate-binding protein